MKNLTTATPSVLLIVFLVGFPQISETIYTPALPNIASSLKATSALAQWTLSVYFIGFALGVFYWGRLSDRIGRRPTMLLGILIFGIASFICLLSQSISWLLIARIIQAFGASVGSVITLTILRESFHDTARNKLFYIVGFALSLTPALGPLIGGYVNDWFGWRANFLVPVLMSLILLAYTFKSLPETKPTSDKNLPIAKFSEVTILLMKDIRVWLCALIIGTINGILFSYYAEAPFIFINLIGITPSAFGWLGLIIASATMLGSLISYRLTDAYSSKQIAFAGCFLMIANSILLCFFSLSGYIEQTHILKSILYIMLPIAGIILGSCGFILPIILSSALNKYKSVLGTAGALFGLSYYLLIAVFTWLMGVIHTGTIVPMPIYFLVLSLITAIAYYFVAMV